MPEMDSNYYDEFYKQSAVYNKADYTENPYYKMWLGVLGLLNKEEKVIDLGCGAGQLSNLLLDNGINYIYGCDFSEEAINISKKNNDSTFEVRNISSEFTYLDLPEYDTVLLIEVLEHINDDRYILEQILKDKRVIFSVPDFWSESHVRIFRNMEEIKSRYSGRLKFINIEKFNVNNSEYNIYLCDCVKK